MHLKRKRSFWRRMLCCCGWKTAREELEEELHLEGLDSAETINLSYQELGDDYQITHLRAILRGLKRAKRLILNDNDLSKLSDLRLPPSLETLYVCRNEFTSFLDLPTCPNLKVLDASDNHIASLDGLLGLFPKLEALVLTGNPITREADYRSRVKKLGLSGLTKLDHISL